MPSMITLRYGGKEVELRIKGDVASATFRNTDELRIPGATTHLDSRVSALLDRMADEEGRTIVEEFQTTDFRQFGLGIGLALWIRARAEVQGYEITYDDGYNVRARRIHWPSAR